jgi:hypothetical protein
LTVISGRALRPCPVIPVSLATVQFSRSAKRRSGRRGSPGPRPAGDRPHAGLSKLNSMRAASGHTRAQPCGLPDPVDVLVADRSRGERRAARRLKAAILPATGALI